jgi:hypothetical protein
MKKATAVFLAFLISLNTFGLFFVYWTQIEFCGYVAESNPWNAESKHLIQLTPGMKNFQPVNEKEVMMEGKIFDIVSKKISNGHAVYTVVSDEKEQECLSYLSQMIHRHSNDSATDGKFAPDSWKFTAEKSFVAFHDDGILYTANPQPEFLFSSPHLPVIAPPPDRYFS